MLRSPDERQGLDHHWAADVEAGFVFVVLGARVAGWAVVGELQGVQVSVSQILKGAAVKLIGPVP